MSKRFRLGALAGAFLLLAAWLFGGDEALRLLEALLRLMAAGGAP